MMSTITGTVAGAIVGLVTPLTKVINFYLPPCTPCCCCWVPLRPWRHLAEQLACTVDDGRQGLVKHLHNFSESKEFNIFIFGTICVAGISVGIQTDREMTGNTRDMQSYFRSLFATFVVFQVG